MLLDLDAMLAPRSLAILGASNTPGSAGLAMIRAAVADGFDGAVYPVNPRYDTIEGHRCYTDLASLPERPDHVVVGIGNAHLSDTFDTMARLQIKSATVFASGLGESEELLPTIKRKAEAANIAVCGPNCMGLLRPETGLRVAAFDARGPIRSGGVVWLAQSGSAFSALTFNQPRLGFKLAVSTGSEMTVDLADYMHWALDQGGVRVIGLFLEGLRNPQRFVAALEKAQAMGVPVVVLKVGRTARSAAMAATHTGALAGNDGAYQALFRRYNVIQVSDLEEMAATLALLEAPRRFVPGGLATMHDSGGERELLVDLSVELGVELAEVSNETKAAIQPNLDTGLTAENPLDAWGTARDYQARFTACADALLRDPSVSALGFFSDPRDGHGYHAGLVSAMTEAARATDKPVFIASNTTLTDDMELCAQARASDMPLIRGTRAALTSIARINTYADHTAETVDPHDLVDLPDRPSGRLDEATGLDLLAQAGISTPQYCRVTSPDALEKVGETLKAPYVLKTDEGHGHKSDLGGVVLNLADYPALQQAYSGMADRLGSRALIMETAPKGIEIGMGAFVDADFGPVVTVCAGGIMIELFKDVQFALAPFGPQTARQMIDQLAISTLLHPHRGQTGADIDLLCQNVSRFSHLVWALRDTLREADVNPLIASAADTVAVDALFVFKEF